MRFGRSLKDKSLVPIKGSALGIFHGGDINHCCDGPFGSHHRDLILAVAMTETFGFIECAFFSRSNPEKNTVDPVSGISGGFDVAFSGTVRTHLVKGELAPLDKSFVIRTAEGMRAARRRANIFEP